MSEKYSTDNGKISVPSVSREPIIPALDTEGMIEVIEDIFGMANRSLEMNPGYVEHHKKWQDVIIARLQAADALISAVREESPLSANVRKAIADYEEKA